MISNQKSIFRHCEEDWWSSSLERFSPALPGTSRDLLSKSGRCAPEASVRQVKVSNLILQNVGLLRSLAVARNDDNICCWAKRNNQ